MKCWPICLLLSLVFCAIPGVAAQAFFESARAVTDRPVQYSRGVASADVDGSGTIDVLVAEYDTGRILWMSNLGGGQFQAPELLLDAEVGIEHMLAQDFDGDGDADLAVVSSTERMLVLYSNNGSGLLGDRRVLSVLARDPLGLDTVDVDADGLRDLVMPLGGLELNDRWYDSGVAYFAGLQEGGFAPGRMVLSDGRDVDYQTQNLNLSERVVATTMADLDGDGRTDVAMALRTSRRISLVVHRSDAAPRYVTEPIEDIPHNSILALNHGDLDGDGVVDLVYSTRDVYWARKTSDGWVKQSLVADSSTARYVRATADVDQDGDIDVLAGYAPNPNALSTGVVVWHNDGEGQFSPSGRAPFEPYIGGLIDIDQNGTLDFFGASREATELAWSEITSEGFATDSPARSIYTSPFYRAEDLQVSDTDRNGRTDVLVLDRSYSYQRPSVVVGFEQVDAGGFGPRRILAPITSALDASDLNGDGRVDVTGVDAEGRLLWGLHSSSGSYDTVPVAEAPTATDRATWTDLDADGIKDVVLVHRTGVEWWAGLGGTRVESGGNVVLSCRREDPCSFIDASLVSDLDGDGDDDIAVAYARQVDPTDTNPEEHSRQIRWFENNGNGAMTEHVVQRWDVRRYEDRRMESLVAFDSDGDGDRELALVLSDSRTRGTANAIVVFEHRDESYVMVDSLAQEGVGVLLAAGNLQGDGRDALLATDPTGAHVDQLDIGDLGGPRSRIATASSGVWELLRLGDVDQDGALDLVGVVSDGPRIVWHRNPRGPVSTQREPFVPEGLRLVGPNPFTGSTRVAITPATTERLQVHLLDLLGRQLVTLHDAVAERGHPFELAVPGGTLPAGAYLVRVTSSSGVWSRVLTRL